jgi:ABC-type multidrug transport system fused ATPase/permease subunit
MTRQPITRLQFLSQLLCPSLYIMVVLMVLEALLAAATTYFIIKAGRDVADDEFLVADLIWILAAQSTSYVAGAVSWVFAERAGFRCYSRYMLRFARANRDQSKLLHDKAAREQAEPFLTGTTFNNVFNLMYEIEAQLKLLLGVVFNAIVLGTEIDPRLSLAFAVVFTILMLLQWSLRGRVANLYLDNQRQNNRLVSHGYTAWDNVFTGNRYNLHLWIVGFKTRIRDCLRAQINAIMAREGLSAAGGIIGLTVVFIAVAYVATHNANDPATLVALAATLPRQIEMTNNVHELASSWNDVLAVWTRVGDVVANMHPSGDPRFNQRIKFDRLLLRSGDHATVCHSVEEAVRLVYSAPTGRITVRGGNGSGKSTLLAALKAEIKNRAYYWPTTDRLAFEFAAKAQLDEPGPAEEDGEVLQRVAVKRPGFSSGERQLKSLQEIVAHTDARIYLLDEWDANLDQANRIVADALVDQLAQRARVVEISHRDAV